MSPTPLPSQSSGCLIGLALGDALGAVVEGAPSEQALSYVRDWLRSGRAAERGREGFPFGQYTDDTQLARELLRSIAERGEFDPAHFAGFIARLFETGSVLGEGPGTGTAARRLGEGVSWRDAGTPSPYAGNGAAMRAGPLGILYWADPDRLAVVAVEQSRITHRDPRCAAGALAVARAVALAATREPIVPELFAEQVAEAVGPVDVSVADMVAEVGRWAEQPPDAVAREILERGLDVGAPPEWQGLSSFVTTSVCWSLYAFLRSPDVYWDAIGTAIAVGGDTDTLGAMTGAISGARVGLEGLPADLAALLTDRGAWGFKELRRLAEDLISGSRPPAA
jgi:ADP-ribosylglycohydrolase